MNSLLLSFVIPLLFTLAALAYLRQKFAFKQWNMIFQSLFFGILSVLVVVLLDQFARTMDWNSLKSLKRTGFYSFVVVGFGAELGKFLVLRYLFLPKKHFYGPVEGVIYSTMISLGFTLAALPLFALGVFSSPARPLFVIFYTLANLAFGVITGFFAGLGKQRRNRLIDSLSGLGTAGFLHGFFYFINLTDEYTIYTLYGLGTLFISAILLVKARNLKNETAVQ
ncbi:MAG: PrsW family intramembrane metalloprotease [Bacteroidetes bacterium]|nr:PrsW family intramembrane metalloprotease [Bacteroidota bacterium]